MEHEETRPSRVDTIPRPLLSEILEMSRNLRFGEGDLLMVRENFSQVLFTGLFGFGPLIRGYSRIQSDKLTPGALFLALGPAKHSARKDNGRLYVELMTPEGPKLCWASAFKMKKKETENA